MAHLYANVFSCVTVFIAVVLFLGGCVAPNLQVTAPTPQVIIQADIPGREIVQPIELDNCDGKADAKRTEHRTRSVESTISAEIAAKFGVSAEVLSAEVQTTVGAAIGVTEGRGTSIELVAPPGTRMAFQLVWVGNEQVGVVQNLKGSSTPIAFRVFKPTDVRIKSQYDIGCPPTPSAQRPVATPETRSVTPVPSPTVRPVVRPAPVHIINGTNYSMPKDWTWVCTGDFSTQANGVKKAWYDVGTSNTGLVLVLQPNSIFTISGPFEMPVGVDVGDCLAYAPDEKDSGISGAINAQFNGGCGSKCQYVNVIELDKEGNKVKDYWIPRKP